jgi:hypothetical protein
VESRLRRAGALSIEFERAVGAHTSACCAEVFRTAHRKTGALPRPRAGSAVAKVCERGERGTSFSRIRLTGSRERCSGCCAGRWPGSTCRLARCMRSRPERRALPERCANCCSRRTARTPFAVSCSLFRRDVTQGVSCFSPIDTYRSRRARLPLTHVDRLLWAWLSQVWPDWRSAVHIVRPETASSGISAASSRTDTVRPSRRSQAWRMTQWVFKRQLSFRSLEAPFPRPRLRRALLCRLMLRVLQA